jgi:hypothetical protein
VAYCNCFFLSTYTWYPATQVLLWYAMLCTVCRGSKDGEDEEEQCKLPSLVHLTQLESLCLDMGEDEEISWWEGSYAIPQIARRFKHLHTLHIPDYPVFGVHVLDTLLKEAPQLTNLSVSGGGEVGG